MNRSFILLILVAFFTSCQMKKYADELPKLDTLRLEKNESIITWIVDSEITKIDGRIRLDSGYLIVNRDSIKKHDDVIKLYPSYSIANTLSNTTDSLLNQLVVGEINKPMEVILNKRLVPSYFTQSSDSIKWSDGEISFGGLKQTLYFYFNSDSSDFITLAGRNDQKSIFPRENVRKSDSDPVLNLDSLTYSIGLRLVFEVNKPLILE